MSSIFPVENSNLSFAWTEAFLALMVPGCAEITPLVVTVTGIDGGKIEENEEIRRLLDKTLARNRSSCHTVANTIFPKSLWNPAREQKLLYERYLKHAWPRVKRCHANNRGTYFQRLIAFENGDDPVNQLEHIIATWHKGNHRHSALQLSILIRGRTIPIADGWDFHVYIRYVLLRSERTVVKVSRSRAFMLLNIFLRRLTVITWDFVG